MSKASSNASHSEIIDEKQQIEHNHMPVVSKDVNGNVVMAASETHGRMWNGALVYSMLAVGLSALRVIGPLTALQPFVEKYQGLNPTTNDYVFTARNQDLLFSVPLVGSVVGALLGDPLQQRFGRKWSLIGGYGFSLGGVFLQLFAPNLGAFVIGRFWNALSYGVATAVAPLFLSEIVPARIRGGTVQANNICSIGSNVIATAILLGTSSFSDSRSYKVPLAIQAALPVLLLLLTMLVPESPVWLVSRNKMEQARHSLRKLRAWSDAQIDDELRIIAEGVAEERALTSSVKFWEIFYPANLRRTITAGSLFSLNQVSGIILSTTYATVFLTQLGVGSPFLLTMVAALTQLAGSVCAPFVIERAGRRPLALIGFSALLVIDIIAGSLAFYTANGEGVLKAIAALGFIFNFCWCLSFYSLSLLMPAELPTPRLRTATMSYCVAAGQTTAVITTFAVPQLVSADAANLGPKTYLVFAGCMVFIIAFAFFLLPETRNRTFAEIDEMFAAGVKPWNWKSYVCKTTAVDAQVVADDKVVSTTMIEDEKATH